MTRQGKDYVIALTDFGPQFFSFTGSRRQRYETTAYMDGAESMGMDILAEATVFSQISDPHLASNPLLQQPFEQDPRQKDWPEEAAQQQASLQEEQGQIHQGDRLNLLSAAVVSVVPDLETPTAGWQTLSC